MQGKACYGECYRELSIGKLGVAYGNPYYRNLGLFRGCLTEQEPSLGVSNFPLICEQDSYKFIYST